MMNLREEILKEHSKAQCTKIVNWIGDKQPRFDDLFYLFINDEYRVVQRAAWPVSYAVINHPFLIKKHFATIFKKLQNAHVHTAVKRNTIRFLQEIDIPEKYEGVLMDLCFGYVASPTEAVAVKAFSLTVLKKLSKKYPEILPEIKLIIEEQLPHQTPAIKVRARDFFT